MESRLVDPTIVADGPIHPTFVDSKPLTAPRVAVTRGARIWLGIVICCVASISCNGRPAIDTLAVEEFDAPAKTILRLRVTAHNFQWRIQYAGADGQLDTDDDSMAAQHLHLPVNSIVEIDLRSEDYAYTFFLPHLDLIETAIPDDPFLLRFETDEPGRHELLGSQMCGYTHPLLLGDVVIHTHAGFNEWLSSIGQKTDSRFIDDPRLDGWNTEILQDSVSTQWKKLAKVLSSKQLFTTKYLEDFVAHDFRCDRLRPASLSVVFRDSALTVRRPSPQTDSSSYVGTEGFHRALSELLGDNAAGLRVQFKIFRVDAAPDDLTTDQFVSIFRKTKHGSREAHAHWRANWFLPTGNAPPRLKSIEVLNYEEAESNSPRGTLFSDCTEAVFSGNKSYRQQLVYSLDYWNNRLLRVDSSGMQGCAVGDVNGDGLDDIYICQSSSLPNRLFLHSLDDTVTDVSAAAGVDWHDQTHGALLIDIDNDGDQDLVFGSTVALVLMENDGHGKFVLRSKIAGARGAYTLCAADYDLDGDLDIFACVYLARWRRRQVLAAPVPFHDARNGGRNVLLRNEGNWKFSDVTHEAGLEAEATRRSFASAWEDFDNDGDLDLYVANDYGRNNLFRNDQGKFTDVAGSARVEDQSFGMSGSWSDFNRDGWMDLYVANMFSAAGNRIVHQRRFRPNESAEVRQQFQYMARGNSLFQNTPGGRFRDVSSQAQIMIGLWSWGSQFVDLNNDGYEDIVVANGYFTRDDPDDL